jgi:hypothetical protein
MKNLKLNSKQLAFEVERKALLIKQSNQAARQESRNS